MQNKEQQLRQRWIDRYVRALDQGDADALEAVLDATLDDPELSAALDEIHQTYLEEAGIPTASDTAHTVARLAHQHLAAVAAQEERQAASPTVGEVAALLMAERQVAPQDEAVNRALLQIDRPLPLDLTVPTLATLFAEIGVRASRHYLRAFKDKALWLEMSRSENRLRLAAREQDRRRP